MNIARKCFLTTLLSLAPIVYSFSQSINIESEITHFIRTGDEESIPKIEAGFRTLAESQDTTTMRNIIFFLTQERELIKEDKAHLFILDILLGSFMMATNDYANASCILEESYNNIKAIKDPDITALHGICYLLSLSHNGEGDYVSARKYAKEMHKYSKHLNPAATYTSYLQMATSELGLGNTNTAYKYIKKAYLSPEIGEFTNRLQINTTYIDILHRLSEIEQSKKNHKKVIDYFKETQKIIIDYPNMRLSSYLDDQYIIDNVFSLVKSSAEENVIEQFVNDIIESCGEAYSITPDSQLTKEDYMTVYSRVLAETAIANDMLEVGKIFYKHVYNLIQQHKLSDDIADNENLWYALYKLQYELDYTFAARLYSQQINNALDKKDILKVKELLNNFLHIYDAATFFVRDFNKISIPENGIYVLPTNDAKYIINEWEYISKKYIQIFGSQRFNIFIKSYRDVPENFRVFPFYSLEDNELLKLHISVYEKDYQKFGNDLKTMCANYNLTDDQIVTIIFRIKELLYRNYNFEAASDFVDYVSENKFLSENTVVSKYIAGVQESIYEWVDFNISTAQGLSQDGNYDEAMAWFDVVLGQIHKENGICNSYLKVLNFKAYESLVHQKYTDAKTTLENAASLYNSNKIDDISAKYTTLCYLSLCYASLGEYDKSLKISQDTYQYINLMRDNYKDYDYWGELCSTYRIEGEALWNLGEFEKAEKILKNSYRLAKENNINIATTDAILQEIIQLYKGRINQTRVENHDDISWCFNQAYSIASDNLDSESYINEFCTDTVIINKLLLAYSRVGKEQFKHFVDSFVGLYDKIFERLYSNGKITETFYTENKSHGFVHLLATSCMELELYEEAVDLYQASIDKCNDPIKRSNRYTMLGIIHQMNIKDYQNSLNYRIKACYELLNSQDPKSEMILEEINQTQLSMKNAIASSTQYYLEMIYDDAHPHLSYDQNIELIEIMSAFLDNLENTYGLEYLNILNEYYLSESDKHSLKTSGTHMTFTVSQKINPLAQCHLEKVLLNISFDNIQEYLRSFDDLMSYICKTYDKNIVEDIKLDIVQLVSDALISNGHYEHSKNLLLSFAGMNKRTDEILSNELVHNAWKASDLLFAIKVLYTDAALIHPTHRGFDHYKTYWDINNLTDQLLILYRILKSAGDEQADEYFNILQQLIDSNCRGLNGNSIKGDFAAGVYNELGCYANSVEEKIEYFKSATKSSENNFMFNANLAYSYTLSGQYEKSDSILNPAVEYINKYYQREQTKHYIYKIKLENSIAQNNIKESKYFSRKLLLNAIADFKTNSKTMTSVNLANYWNDNYSDLLTSIATCDGNGDGSAETSYDAALFQKGVLLRSQNYRKNNILHSKDTLLMYLYDRYCIEQRNNSDSTEYYEKGMMYFYSLHPEFMDGEITPSWEDVKNTLGRKDVAIEFAIMKDIKDGKYYYSALILANKYDAPKLVRLCKTETLKELLSKSKLNNGYSTVYDEYNNGSNTLYALIWSPIESYIKGYKNIYFSPYEQLNFINIESLQKSENSKRMNELYNIVRVSTTGQLPNRRLTLDNAVLYGGIDYNVSDQYKVERITNKAKIDSTNTTYSELRGYMNNWSYLSNTYDEVEYIKDELESINISTAEYTGTNGTEDTFKSLSGNNVDIIHLATHGFYFTDEDARKSDYFVNDDNKTICSGNRSGILFAGANIAWSGSDLPNDVEDGILNSDEIMGMNLTGTDLLVLSACQSGLGDISNDGTYGIQRSFKIAGVNTIIMSLWEVDDEATRIMMTSFYKGLSEGKSVRASFMYAVKTVRKTYEERAKTQSRHIPKHKRYDSAYYWTSFILLD